MIPKRTTKLGRPVKDPAGEKRDRSIQRITRSEETKLRELLVWLRESSQEQYVGE